MRKLIIVFLAVSFLAACNNNKKDPRDDRRTDREKDDYRDKEEDNKDAKNTDYKDDSKTTDDMSSGGWKSNEVEIFVTNCTDEAAKGGMLRSKAQDYCECMQRKLEVMYPNAADVGNIDTESASMQDMIKKCLGM